MFVSNNKQSLLRTARNQQLIQLNTKVPLGLQSPVWRSLQRDGCSERRKEFRRGLVSVLIQLGLQRHSASSDVVGSIVRTVSDPALRSHACGTELEGFCAEGMVAFPVHRLLQI